MKRQINGFIEQLDLLISKLQSEIKAIKNKPLKKPLLNLMVIELEKLENIKAAQSELIYLCDIFTKEKVITLSKAQTNLLRVITNGGYLILRKRHEHRIYLHPHCVPNENVINALVYSDIFYFIENEKGDKEYKILPKFLNEVENQIAAGSQIVKIIYEL
jgi:hypothetical protein